MAEGLLRSLYGEKYEAYSAGATPTKISPYAVKVMAEIGIDISGQSSKSIETYRGRAFDLVVTVCKSTPRLSCPFCSSPGQFGTPRIITETLPNAKRFVEHGFVDPSEVEGGEEERLEAFRRVRDEMMAWIKASFRDLNKVE
jgi:arsenate reductase